MDTTESKANNISTPVEGEEEDVLSPVGSPPPVPPQMMDPITPKAEDEEVAIAIVKPRSTSKRLFFLACCVFTNRHIQQSVMHTNLYSTDLLLSIYTLKRLWL